MIEIVAILGFFAGGWLAVLTLVLVYGGYRLVTHAHIHEHANVHQHPEYVSHEAHLTHEFDWSEITTKLRRDLESHRHDEANLAHAHFWVQDGDAYMGQRGTRTARFQCVVAGCSAKAEHELV